MMEEELQKQTKEMVDNLELTIKLFSESKIPEYIAKLIKIAFDNLLKQGFTEKQSMQIVTHMNIGNNKNQ